MTACCGGRGRELSVAACVDAGLRTRRRPPLAVAGESIAGPDGLAASFSLAIDADHLSAARFRCTSCITLIAYCEALCRLVMDAPLAEAAGTTAPSLVAALPGVPAYRQDRAVLAVAALRSALLAGAESAMSNPRGESR